jgi:hypothetical protein
MRNRTTLWIGTVLGVVLLASSASAMSSAEPEFVDLLEYDELGMVSEGNPLSYSHTFAPPDLDPGQVADVTKVQLAILLTDDLNCAHWVECRYDLRTEGDWAVIEVEGSEIFDGELELVNLVVRDVTLLANITASGDAFSVTIESAGGDFAAIFSAASFYYSDVSPGTAGAGTTAVPEPSAALAFGVGLLVLSRRLRS